jgi:type VI secretion system secreted protein VgrG
MRPTRRLTTGGIRLTDYNFKTPLAAMEVDRMGDAAYAEGQIESYDYPGDYLEAGQGKDVARLRTLQERGQDHRHQAVGDCTSMRAGQTVKVTGDKVDGVNDPCLCLSARHTFTADGYASGQGSDEATYEGNYVLLPTSAPLAPERKTFIPKVQGPQTAVVVGDGEIDCDEYGRILVHFHWDLDKRFSMRCRVSQNWASKGWGGMVIPRIGMEVVVEFLEGDPDKPLVTGCVYNGKNDVPYPLPANKTRSTFKTDTHQGTGFNELRFEDEKDKEEIFVHGQKDMNMEILNDRTKRIGNDQSEFVGNDQSIEVGGDHDEVISGNLSIAVGSNPLATTLMSKTSALFSKVGGVMEKMKIPDPFNFAKGNMQMFIEKNKSEVVNGASSEIVGVAKSTIVGHTFQQSVGKAMSLIVRGRSDTDVGQVMNIRVGDQFTIKVGENSVFTMSKEGDILIKGKSIKLDADKINMN